MDTIPHSAFSIPHSRTYDTSSVLTSDPSGNALTPSPPQFQCRLWHIGCVVIFALLLHVPTLNMGFFADDYTQQVVLQGLAEHPTLRVWNLYDFGEAPRPGNPTFESGVFPWWSSDDWKGRFFRPLTSLTLWLDYAIFGGWAMGYHLTSLVWYAALLVLTYKLYQSLGLSDAAALAGLVILAAMHSSLFPVGWPPNRNSLIEAVFLVASILVLSRCALGARWITLAAAVLLGILACLSKESGVAAFVLIAVYLHGLRRTASPPPPARWVWAGTLICASLALAHLILFVSAGFGTNTTFYPMPWQHPLAFAERLLVLSAVAPLSFVGLFPTDILSLQPQYALPVALICLIPSAVICRVFWKHVRGFPGTWFWLAWIVTTILPQGAPPTSDRLLFQASIGASALLGLFVTAGWKRRAGGSVAPRRHIIASLITVGVFVVSPITLLFEGTALHYLAAQSREALVTADLGDPSLGRREVFLLQSSNDLETALASSVWAVERGETNVRGWPMQLGGRGLRWTRIDERTFDLETLGESFLTRMFEKVFLTSNNPPPVARKWRTALFTVEAMDSGPEGLKRFRVTCPVMLEDRRYRFLMIDGGGRLIPVSPPTVGKSLDIPKTKPPVSLIFD